MRAATSICYGLLAHLNCWPWPGRLLPSALQTFLTLFVWLKWFEPTEFRMSQVGCLQLKYPGKQGQGYVRAQARQNHKVYCSCLVGPVPPISWHQQRFRHVWQTLQTVKYLCRWWPVSLSVLCQVYLYSQKWSEIVSPTMRRTRTTRKTQKRAHTDMLCKQNDKSASWSRK